jgi:endonuclease/exonuclease/phosphatase family metal-dependent hydrolase
MSVYPYQIREPLALRDCGNMILSRHPLGEAKYIRLSDAEAAYWLQRATVFMSGRSIALYNVHLEKPLSGVPRQLFSARKIMSAMLNYDPDRRNQQMERLIEVLSEERFPSVVAGDFNMSEYSIMYSEMVRNMHDAFRSAGSGFGATWPAKTNSPVLAFLPPLLRIDYIWHNESLRTLEADVGPSLGSDHLPVRAKLQWRDRG